MKNFVNLLIIILATLPAHFLLRPLFIAAALRPLLVRNLCRLFLRANGNAFHDSLHGLRHLLRYDLLVRLRLRHSLNLRRHLMHRLSYFPNYLGLFNRDNWERLGKLKANWVVFSGLASRQNNDML